MGKNRQNVDYGDRGRLKMFFALVIFGICVVAVIVIAVLIQKTDLPNNVSGQENHRISCIDFAPWGDYIDGTAMENGSQNSPLNPGKNLYEYVEEIKNAPIDNQGAECKIIRRVGKL